MVYIFQEFHARMYLFHFLTHADSLQARLPHQPYSSVQVAWLDCRVLFFLQNVVWGSAESAPMYQYLPESFPLFDTSWTEIRVLLCFLEKSFLNKPESALKAAGINNGKNPPCCPIIFLFLQILQFLEAKDLKMLRFLRSFLYSCGVNLMFPFNVFRAISLMASISCFVAQSARSFLRLGVLLCASKCI